MYRRIIARFIQGEFPSECSNVQRVCKEKNKKTHTLLTGKIQGNKKAEGKPTLYHAQRHLKTKSHTSLFASTTQTRHKADTKINLSECVRKKKRPPSF